MRSVSVFAITVVFLSFALPGLAQLEFDPVLGDTIWFDDTEIDQRDRTWVFVIGHVEHDQLIGVNVRVEGDYFSVSPTEFLISDAQEIPVTLYFAPEQAGMFYGRLLFEAIDHNDNQYSYATVLAGRGLNHPAGEIEVDAERFDVQINADRQYADIVFHMTNVGNADLHASIEPSEVGWLRMDGGDRLIQPGVTRNYQGRIAGIAVSGVYETTFVVTTDDTDEARMEIPVRVEVNLPEEVEQRIRLRAGWNLISLNVTPAERYLENGTASMRLVLEPIANSIQLVRDDRGRFIFPRLNHWGFRAWETGKAYQIRVSEEVYLTVTGAPIEASEPVELPQGWSFVAYYPLNRQFANRAFRSLTPDEGYNLIKNGLGQFWAVGRGGFDWEAQPGQGYMVRLNEPMTLRYLEQ